MLGRHRARDLETDPIEHPQAPDRPAPGGGGDQALPGDRSFHYPPPVTGQINGQPVPCVDAATQVAGHLGYPPTAKDRIDRQALHDTLGTPIPSSLRAC
ncbi:MAG TPA: hypothetical protein VFI65_08195 [Streptosporangiaceae bacterium]|nr:hypothetical protein [Streptosporangiaceae bacterium]